VNSIALTIRLYFLSIFRIALKGEYCHLHPLKRLENIPNPTRSPSSLLIPISTHHGQQKIVTLNPDFIGQLRVVNDRLLFKMDPDLHLIRLKNNPGLINPSNLEYINCWTGEMRAY
jgi:hypothetical protein